jgi:chromosomal replication initiation ATPase DnaA
METVITRKKIVEAVSKYTGVSVNKIVGTKRTADLVFARQLSMYIMYNYLADTSFPSIGDFFEKHHTSIMHSNKEFSLKMAGTEICYEAVRHITSTMGLVYVPKNENIIKENVELKAKVKELQAEIFNLRTKTA